MPITLPRSSSAENRRRRPRRRRLQVGAAGSIALLCAAATCLGRAQVRGESMSPALLPGDHLLIVRLPARWPLRVGSVVALRDPRAAAKGAPVLVKRVQRVDDRTVEVVGDNPAQSTDSRAFGPVPRGCVIGMVLYRYAPSERTGRIR